MASYNLQIGMPLQYTVAGVYITLVARTIGMQVHIILLVLLKIDFIVVCRHLLYRKPAVFRFAYMNEQWNVLFFKVPVYIIKPWVVGHYFSSILILIAHPNVFPYFNGYCP